MRTYIYSVCLYILTVIDEYSRFPFAFPCRDMSADTVIRCLESLFALCGTPESLHSDRGSQFMSDLVRDFLIQKGIAQSRTSPYNPAGNGQCERFNGTIWKAVSLCLKSRSMKENQWESVLPEVLHSIRSLLCTTTNCTPHERFFQHARRSTMGSSLPTWLLEAKSVLVKRHVRLNKSDPLVDTAEVIQINPQYAIVRLSNGRETSVSLRDIAPAQTPPRYPHDEALDSPTSLLENNGLSEDISEVSEANQDSDECLIESSQSRRHSSRPKRAPVRMDL
jgi:hypothetical protein